MPRQRSQPRVFGFDPGRGVPFRRFARVVLHRETVDRWFRRPVDQELTDASHPGAKLVVLSSVNHVLKPGSRDRAETQANYANPSLPLAPGVVEAIVAFVKP